MRKLLHSRAGFTLIELMIALSILMLVVFTFTPVMLQSLLQIQNTGKAEVGTYREQAEIEGELAKRGQGVDPHPDVTVPVVFDKIVGGAAAGSSPPIPIRGKQIKGTGAMQLSTVYVGQDTTLSAAPPSYCDDIDLVGKQVTIHGGGVDFLEGASTPEAAAASFSFWSTRSGSPGEQIGSGEVSFQVKDKNTAIMTILGKSITMARGPYQIRYGNAAADFSITPPAILIVGDNKAGQAGYWVSDGRADADGHLNFSFRDNFAQETLRGVAWNDQRLRYEVVGDLYDNNSSSSDRVLHSYTTANRWSNTVRDRIWTLDEHNYTDPEGIWWWPRTKPTSPQPQAIYDDVQCSTVGIFSNGEAQWGGSALQNWYYSGSLTDINWIPERNPGKRKVAFYGVAGSTNPTLLPGSDSSVVKILTGFRCGAEGEAAANVVDVVFRNHPSDGWPTLRTHYQLMGSDQGISIYPQGGNRPVGAITAAAYGLITPKAVTQGSEPCYKVAVGNQIYRSPDTDTNNRVGLGDAGTTESYWPADTIRGTAPNPIRDIAFGLDRWVAVGEGQNVLTSTDGRSWTAHQLKMDFYGGPWNLRSVTFTAGHFVAVGDYGLVAYSPDGINWTVNKLGNDTFYGVAGQ